MACSSSEFDDHQADARAFGGTLALRLAAGNGAGEDRVSPRAARRPRRDRAAEVRRGAAVAAGRRRSPPSIQPLGDDGKPLNLGFETGTLEGWKAEGNAWEGQPIKGDTVARAATRAQQSRGPILDRRLREDRRQAARAGSPRPAFAVTHPWASFLVGGGKDPKLDARGGRGGSDRQSHPHAPAGSMPKTMRREVGRSAAVRRQADLRAARRRRHERLGASQLRRLRLSRQAPSRRAPARPRKPGSDRVARQKESPVLWHLQPNPAKPTAVAECRGAAAWSRA